MKRFVSAISALLLLALAVCAGCTARSKMVAIEPLDTDLSPYASVVISVQSNVSEDMEEEISNLEFYTIKEINKLEAFEKVELSDIPVSSEGTLLIKIAISQIKRVSGSDRFWGGALAGRASMTTEISFIDAASGKRLGSYTVTGESGGMGISGGTGEAVRETAKGIADVLSKNFTK